MVMQSHHANSSILLQDSHGTTKHTDLTSDVLSASNPHADIS